MKSTGKNVEMEFENKVEYCPSLGGRICKTYKKIVFRDENGEITEEKEKGCEYYGSCRALFLFREQVKDELYEKDFFEVVQKYIDELDCFDEWPKCYESYSNSWKEKQRKKIRDGKDGIYCDLNMTCLKAAMYRALRRKDIELLRTLMDMTDEQYTEQMDSSIPKLKPKIAFCQQTPTFIEEQEEKQETEFDLLPEETKCIIEKMAEWERTKYFTKKLTQTYLLWQVGVIFP
jgi:hypothetical protein